MPKLFDNNSYEQWIAEGAQDVTARALQATKSMLKGYEQPPMDQAADEALRDYIARVRPKFRRWTR